MSWASSPSSITQQNVNQVRIGQTTEMDLVQLFGTPTTRDVDLAGNVSLDWFRSVPAPPKSYIPVFAPFLGAPTVEAQQLFVMLSPGGRVILYEVHSSRETLHPGGMTTTSNVHRSGYSK
ncbi:MAG: hypothetical protein ABI540_02825 [Spartobacteria bacterium]